MRTYTILANILLLSTKLMGVSHDELVSLCPFDSTSTIKFTGTLGQNVIDTEMSNFRLIQNAERKIIGFKGTIDGSREFYFGRDGDRGDGDIDEIRDYNVGTYPYHFRFQTAPIGKIDEEEEVEGYYAIGGSFKVHSVGTVYLATFKFTQLADGNHTDEHGPIVAGEAEGCIRTMGL